MTSRTGSGRRGAAMMFVSSLALMGAMALSGAAFGQFDPAPPCQMEKLIPPGAAPYTNFGAAVAIGGDVAVIGSWSEEGLHVYRFDGAVWQWEAQISGPGHLGDPVAVDGDVLIAGDGLDDDNGYRAGAAHVFRFDGSAWAHETKLLASDGQERDWFGAAVAIDGDRALIGAHQNNPYPGGGPGGAYVFHYDGSTWVEEAKLTASDGASGDKLGHSVAIRGDLAVLGAPSHDGLGSSAGAAYVYRFDGSAWSEEGKLEGSDTQGGDGFGKAVAVDGERAIVGAWHHDHRGAESGAAYAFAFDGSTWVEDQELLASNGAVEHEFGCSISLSGETAIIGAASMYSGPAVSAWAYVFHLDGSTWSETAMLSGDYPPWDQFGYDVAIDGDRAIVGAIYDGGEFGAAYLFAGMINADCNANGVADGCDIFNGTSPDLNGNGIPDECEIPGDVNGDGVVDVQDLLAVLSAWGPCASCPEDLNGDGTVSVLDLLIVLANWT